METLLGNAHKTYAATIQEKCFCGPRTDCRTVEPEETAVATEWLGKHAPTPTDLHATIKTARDGAEVRYRGPYQGRPTSSKSTTV